MTTKGERIHLDRIALAGCTLCHRLGHGHTPCEIHHPREGQGMSQRADHMLGFGLCPEHHRGKSGYHGLGKAAFESRYKCTELDLLSDCLRRIFYGFD